MNRRAWNLRAWLGIGIVLVGTMPNKPAGSQITAPINPSDPTMTAPSGLPRMGGGGRRGGGRITHAQIRVWNEARQKQIVADTAKLLILVNELKASVNQSKEDAVLPEMAKKLDEIEKLAHRVKAKETE